MLKLYKQAHKIERTLYSFAMTCPDRCAPGCKQYNIDIAQAMGSPTMG